MEQTKFSLYKSPPMRPFLSTHLVTSTPDSYQISKRIKGLLGYSEHYKGSRVDYPNLGPKFSPLQTRDYRKARELTLEIWDPMCQISFLERFLKSQRNLQDIRIKVLTKKEYKGEILKRLCEILCKIGRLNRVYIDFVSEQERQVKPELSKRVRSMRKLPRLKDLEVTLNGQQVLPFSVSLTKVGFDSENPNMAKPSAAVEKLIHKALKFHHLDTITIDMKNFNLYCDERVLENLALVISKLPNFRELDFNYSKDLNISLQQNSNILDALAKAPKFEIIRFGFPLPGKSQISLLKHPLFKAKSLKRTYFSFYFIDNDEITSEDLNDIFDLLGRVPSLYELSLRFYSLFKVNDEIAESHMERISRMTSIRKLKIVFDSPSRTLSEKQTGNIFRSIFKMSFLEELFLGLPQACPELNARDIQGLPRLRKISIHLERFKSENLKDVLTIVEILGKCHQLRELELRLRDRDHDCQGITMKLLENLGKLKRLQVFKLDAYTFCEEVSNMTMDLVEDLLKICHQLRDLQDLKISMVGLNLYLKSQGVIDRFLDLEDRLTKNPKYRHSTFLCM